MHTLTAVGGTVIFGCFLHSYIFSGWILF